MMDQHYAVNPIEISEEEDSDIIERSANLPSTHKFSEPHCSAAPRNRNSSHTTRSNIPRHPSRSLHNQRRKTHKNTRANHRSPAWINDGNITWPPARNNPSTSVPNIQPPIYCINFNNFFGKKLPFFTCSNLSP